MRYTARQLKTAGRKPKKQARQTTTKELWSRGVVFCTDRYINNDPLSLDYQVRLLGDYATNS